MRPGQGLAVGILAAALLGAQAAEAGTTIPIRTGGLRLGAPVTSFRELREAGLVRQGWDISCGAAALSTILTHHFKDAYSEATIAVSILKNTDPKKVRARGGFSLLDLKRFAEAVGYVAKGYAGLTVKDLAESPVPAILPVRIRGYDHFVVFRGKAGAHILVGDPAFGNLTMRLGAFEEVWTSGIGFFVYGDETADAGRSPLAPSALNMMVPNLNYVYRMLRGEGPVPATRRPTPRLPNPPLP